jgi:hypothetical protein
MEMSDGIAHGLLYGQSLQEPQNGERRIGKDQLDRLQKGSWTESWLIPPSFQKARHLVTKMPFTITYFRLTQNHRAIFRHPILYTLITIQVGMIARESDLQTT